MTDPHPASSTSISASSIAAGHILGGKYRLESQLGAGGMGVVFSATHLELDAPVAIKLIRDEFARNEEVVGRMLFEARAAAKLKSSHVVRVLDVARLETGAPYIVMERLEGCDLSTLLIENGPLPVQQAVDYVLEACEALVEAHALGIIHRDLKPENLFCASTPEGPQIKVLDFGISKDTSVFPGSSPRSVMTTAGYALGSPYYMAPEQMRAEDVDARADVWSLGAILYELTCGHCPFEGESLPVVCAAVLSGAEARPLSAAAPQVPAGLSAVVARCLRKQRTQRFESVAQLASALRAYASSEGQRSADRSSRPASGSRIQLKRDRATATPAPVAAAVAGPSLASSRGSRRYAAPAAVLCVLAGLAVASAVTRRPADAAVSQKPVAATTVAVTNLAATAPVVAVAAPRPVAAVMAPAAGAPAAGAPSAALRAPRAPRRAPPSTPAGSAAPIAAPATTPVTSALPASEPAVDAWDPDLLGGRY